MASFEGGQMPLHRRLPKRGFAGKPEKARPEAINLGRIQELIDAGHFAPGDRIDEAALLAAGAVRRAWVKVLGEGEIRDAVRLNVSEASRGAVARVSEVGGTIDVAGRVLRRRRLAIGGKDVNLSSALRQRKDGSLRVEFEVGLDMDSVDAQDVDQYVLLLHPVDADRDRLESLPIGFDLI